MKKIRNRFEVYPQYEDILCVNNSKNIYIKFSEFDTVKQIADQNNKLPEKHPDKLSMCPVNKLPLDLNEANKIVLVTVYNEKININVFSIYEIFKSYGQI